MRHQLVGDGSVRQSLGHQLGDLPFPFGQGGRAADAGAVRCLLVFVERVGTTR